MSELSVAPEDYFGTVLSLALVVRIEIYNTHHDKYGSYRLGTVYPMYLHRFRCITTFKAVQHVLQQNTPQMLEPIMDINLRVPNQYVG
jgi:translation elongation factor EF-G